MQTHEQDIPEKKEKQLSLFLYFQSLFFIFRCDILQKQNSENSMERKLL